MGRVEDESETVAFDVESRDLARVVLDNMYQFAALLDVDGNLLDVNQTALDGGGIQREAVLGRPFWEAHWWKDSAETRARLRDAIARAARGEFVRYEVDVFGGGGGSELITIDFSLTPVRDREGRVIYLLPEGRNITEKKLAESELEHKSKELARLYERLRDFDRVKTQFFANVSHEVRTPLALVVGPVERLLSDERLDPTTREPLEVVQRNARTVLKHVNDLLELSRLEAGRMPMNYATTDVSKLLRFVASHFDVLASDRGIDLRFDVPEGAVIAELDAEKTQRIVLNLLSNSFKFVPDGGKIEIALEYDTDALHIRVDDSGPGIPEEMAELVFERFRQIDGSSTRRRGGTGLGLSIVHEFVQLQRGMVVIDRSRWHGARVIVTLPRRAPEGTAIDRSLPFDPEPGRSIVADLVSNERRSPPARVADEAKPIALIVEDHPEMNDFVASVLADAFRVVQAFDGSEALALLRDRRPDLVVSDVMMPRTSGDALVLAIRGDPSFDDVPIVMLTAKADDELRIRMLRSGVDDWVQKPFSPSELLARATRLMTERRRTVDAIRRSQARFRRIVETAREGIVSLDDEWRMTFVNRAFASFVATPPEAMRGASLLEFVIEEDRPAMRDWLGRVDETSQAHEVRFRRPDESIAFGLASATANRDATDLSDDVVMMISDITQQKQVELGLVDVRRDLERALREKDVLLREVHHRVKNNLQVVSSLLFLQTDERATEAERDALLEAGNRIQAIALVHEVLHRTDDVFALDFGSYVERLCQHVREVHSLDRGGRIELRVDADSAVTTLDTAVPCGLILHELLSNAVEHAFPDERRGTIDVVFHALDDRFSLTVSDDGVGFGGISSEESNLGLRLVRRLVGQVGAVVEDVPSLVGTTIRLSIPRTSSRPSIHARRESRSPS